MTVNRILCTWIVLVQVLLWSGLALRVHQYGWHPYWVTEVLAGVQLYMLAPLLTPSKGVWRRARSEADGGSGMSHVPGYDQDDAHLTVQPWPGHSEERSGEASQP